LLLVGSDAGFISAFDTRTQLSLVSFKSHSSVLAFPSAAASDCELFLLSQGRDGLIKVWLFPTPTVSNSPSPASPVEKLTLSSAHLSFCAACPGPARTLLAPLEDGVRLYRLPQAPFSDARGLAQTTLLDIASVDPLRFPNGAGELMAMSRVPLPCLPQPHSVFAVAYECGLVCFLYATSDPLKLTSLCAPLLLPAATDPPTLTAMTCAPIDENSARLLIGTSGAPIFSVSVSISLAGAPALTVSSPTPFFMLERPGAAHLKNFGANFLLASWDHRVRVLSPAGVQLAAIVLPAAISSLAATSGGVWVGAEDGSLRLWRPEIL
jgi:hypothetical protein